MEIDWMTLQEAGEALSLDATNGRQVREALRRLGVPVIRMGPRIEKVDRADLVAAIERAKAPVRAPA